MIFLKQAKCGPHTLEVQSDGDDLVVYTSGDVRYPELWKTAHYGLFTPAEEVRRAFDHAIVNNKLTYQLEYINN